MRVPIIRSMHPGFWILTGALSTGALCSCNSGQMRPPKDVTFAAARPVVTARPGAGARAGLTDEEISSAVFTEFERDPGIDDHRVFVTTNDGIVQLTGTVHDLLSKERAARVAEEVRGVRAVSNRLRLEIPKRDDTAIERDVSSALLLNAATNSLDIQPSSKNGVVTLKGKVGSWQERQLAVRMAKRVRGVRGVDDDIDVVYRTLRSDPAIKDDVESRLHWDTLVDEDPLTVSVGAGTVRIRGEVGSAAERARAYADAWVNGVHEVDVSSVVVDPYVKARAIRAPGAAHPSDADIAQAIEDATVYDPRVKSFDIRPEVSDGTVTLRGIVDNLQAKRAAESIARHTVGVVDVRSRIQVRSETPETDHARAERIKSALAIDPITDTSDIAVDVRDGRVTLKGTVDNSFVSAEADELAGGVSGVRSVDDQLDVKHLEDENAFGQNVRRFGPYLGSWTLVPRQPMRSDSQITTNIERQFRSSPAVDPNRVNVRVQGGTATLTGKVDSWKERSAATEDAFRGGAIAVRNELQVR